MTKIDLITKVAGETEIKKAVVEKVLNAITDAIAQALKDGDKIALTGFGTFQCSKRAARTGRNPKTGKEINISACTVPKFKPGNKLKEAVQ
ncbi:MAG TPA: HU family DNA-binding protein [Syntrophorhabdales bacterium]|nr:HU family DNA-binding protein [Syntrophorhabdales bacterium]